ncbi:hypothetical protein Tsp_07513 [Trichinella spiralis]|uniref:hypothetical protein n=1 Tax=Trichinella spiralis TaxID=6334 RepID=UPI0001EFB3A5|nr:hypothetical protein Tsp_07513 [Trichinella spiralis]
MSFCFIGVFNVVPLNQYEANFTTPHSCLFLKPYYLLALTSLKQSPMISFCIAIVQVRNACSTKCSTKKPLLKTTILLCGICLLNICLTGTTTYYGTGGKNWQSKVSEFCLFIDVISPALILCDIIIILLFSTLSLLLYISTVLIIWSRISTSHVIHEIRFIRQKVILQRLKIFIIAQLLNSGIFALCTFVVALSLSKPVTVPYFWCLLPPYKAGTSVLYTNQILNSLRWHNKLLKNDFRETAVPFESSANVPSIEEEKTEQKSDNICKQRALNLTDLDQKKAIQSALPCAWNILHSLKDDKQFDDYLKIAQLSKSIDTASVENFVIVSKRKTNG